MKKTVSLKRNNDFKRLYYRGKTVKGQYFVSYFRPNNLGINRLGLTVGQKHGNAVRRNRIKRRMSEAYRLNELNFKKGYDIVLVARVKAQFADFSQLMSDLYDIFCSMGLCEL